MTVHEATLRALLLAPKILALCENDKERRKQIQIWKNELSKYEGSVPTPMPSQ